MVDYFLGSIVQFPFSYAPRGFALCNGAILPVAQNAALFSLLGNDYGGSYPQQTFGLPDLRGATPVNTDFVNTGYLPGNFTGAETVTLNMAQMGAHNHVAAAVNIAAVKSNNPTGKNRAFAQSSQPLYGASTVAGQTVGMNSGVLGVTGGGAAHSNLQPYLTINFCIAMTGFYPTRP